MAEEEEEEEEEEEDEEEEDEEEDEEEEEEEMTNNNNITTGFDNVMSWTVACSLAANIKSSDYINDYVSFERKQIWFERKRITVLCQQNADTASRVDTTRGVSLIVRV